MQDKPTPVRMLAETSDAIAEEVLRARTKFPSSQHMMIALMEEVGELAEAVLVHGSKSERAREEAIQVACVAVRIIEEGDSSIVESVETKPAQPTPVIGNVFRHRSGAKWIIRTMGDAEVSAARGDEFVCEKAHQDSDYSYLCNSAWCRCRA